MHKMKILTWNARKAAGLTLQELSDKTGISKTTLNDIENQIVSPTLIQLEKIAIALDTQITALFTSNYK